MNREQPLETLRSEATKPAGGPDTRGEEAWASAQARRVAKIGLVVPSSQTVTEPLFYRMAPPGVSFFTSRMLLTGTSLSHLQAMELEFDRAVDELASAGVDCLMKCCTLGGAMNDPAAEARACEETEKRTGIPTGSTVLAVVESLRLLGVSRLVVVTPYGGELDRVEEDFLEKSGFQIVNRRNGHRRRAGVRERVSRDYLSVRPAKLG